MADFVLELEVSFSSRLLKKLYPNRINELGTKRTLEKKLDVAVVLRNTAKGEALHRLHILKHDREYQKLQEEYALRKKKDPEADTADLEESYNICMDRAGYTEYAMHDYIKQAKYHFHNILGADECQKVATQAFRAVENIRTGNAKKVRFLPKNSDSSVEGKSYKSTLKYIGNCCIQFGRGNVYPLIVKKKDRYAMEVLKYDDRIKFVRLVRRTIRGKQRYFVQLVMEGIPPKTKNLSYGRKNSHVGLDLGTSTVAIVSHSEVSLKELAPETSVDEKELRRLNRAIDRSKRATNPDNYNEDGTIKKGRRKWNKSKRCIRLENERKELYRRSAWNRKCSHNRLANHIVSLGGDIRVEKMRISALAKRSSKTTVNKKNGRIRSKKRYGKVIMNRAPAYLVSVIDRKLRYMNSSIKEVDTFSVKASQYDHRSNTYRKKALSDRWHVFQDGTKVQRDIYSAFLICYTTDSLDSINRDACTRNYKNFKQLHDEEIMRLQELDNKSLRWYVA